MGDTLSRPFIYPSLLIPGHAIRRETSGGRHVSPVGEISFKGFNGEEKAIRQKPGLTAFKWDSGLKKGPRGNKTAGASWPSNKNKS